MDDEQIDLVEFLSVDSEDDDEEVVQVNKPKKNIVNDLINKVAKQQIQEKMTYKGAAKMANMLNQMPNAAIQLHVDRNSIKKFAYKQFEYEILVHCDTCDDLVLDKTTCNGCKRVMMKDSKKYNFIVHIHLEQQIRFLLNKYFDVIIAYLNRKHSNEDMTDIDDGNLFKKINASRPNVNLLSLTLNVDGANIQKSSQNSLWPVQFYLNALPPNIRFLHKNVIVTTLYYAKKKPNMTTLLYPVARELDFLNKEFISVYKNEQFYHFLPALTICSCDIPARAELQNIKNATGFHACPYCNQKGESIKNLSKGSTVRYVKSSHIELCSHMETIELAKRAEASGKPINGIKGYSVII